MSDLSVANGQTVTTTTNLGGADTVTVANGGAINVAGGNGLFWNANATGGGIHITNDGTITGTGSGGGLRSAFNLTGTITITNNATGVIQGNGIAVGLNTTNATTPTETLTNAGVITNTANAHGTAVLFGWGSDTLNVVTGGVFNGRVLALSDTGTINLSGSGSGSIMGSSEGFDSSTGLSTFAGWDGFSTVNVNSGTWTLYGGGYYDALNVASGATFVVDDTHSAAHGTPSDGGIGPLHITMNIVNNGTVVLRNSLTDGLSYDSSTPVDTSSPTAPIHITGTGTLQLEGNSVLAPNFTLANVPNYVIANGTHVVLGTVTGATGSILAGATLQIGGGGADFANDFDDSTYHDPGNTGTVTSDLTDNGTLIFARTDSYALPGALLGTGIAQKIGAGTLTLGGTTNFHGQFQLNGGVLVNNGALADTNASQAAVFSTGDATNAITVTNNATISSVSGDALSLIDTHHAVTVTNIGALMGGTSLPAGSRVAVDLSGFGDTFSNSGAIGGAVNLGGGADVMHITAGSTISGTVDGGSGSDTVTFDSARSAFAVHTQKVGGTFVTTLGDTTPFGDGTNTVQNVETYTFNGASFGFAGIQQNRTQNLDGHRFDDVLFQQTSTGTVYYQDMNGNASPGGFQAVLGGLPTGWKAVGSADMNGDGRADTILQDTNTGSLYYIDQSGGFTTWATITNKITSAWQFMGAGDVNGDGSVDVVIRDSTTGSILYRDVAHGSWGSVVNPGLGWKVVGVGDFNRDGYSDVAIQNQTDGTVYYVNMAGGSFSGWGLISGAVGTDWKVVGIGDLTGDGYSDVVYQNQSSGTVWYVDMTGGAFHNWGSVAGVSGWTVRDVADLNNDGYADVVIQNNSDGTVYYADMQGGAFHTWGLVSGALGTDWLVV